MASCKKIYKTVVDPKEFQESAKRLCDFIWENYPQTVISLSSIEWKKNKFVSNHDVLVAFRRSSGKRELLKIIKKMPVNMFCYKRVLNLYLGVQVGWNEW